VGTAAFAVQECNSAGEDSIRWRALVMRLVTLRTKKGAVQGWSLPLADGRGRPSPRAYLELFPGPEGYRDHGFQSHRHAIFDGGFEAAARESF